MPLHKQGNTYAITLLVNDPNDPSKTIAYFPKTYAEGILLDLTNPDNTFLKHINDSTDKLHLTDEIRNLLNNLGTINGILQLDEKGYIPSDKLPKKIGLLQYEFNTYEDLLSSGEFLEGEDYGRLVSVKEMNGHFGINGWATMRLIGDPADPRGWMWIWTMANVERTADWSNFTPLFRSTVAQIDAMVQLSHSHIDPDALNEFTEDEDGNLYYKDIKIPDRNSFRSLIVTYSLDGINLLPGDVGMAITDSREKNEVEDQNPLPKIEILSGDCTGLYKDKTALYQAPKIDTKDATNITEMFYGCKSLVSTYQYDFNNVKYADECFKDCINLVGVTDYGEKELVTASSMYENSGIKYHPGMVAPKVINLSYFFKNSKIKYFGDFICPLVERLDGFAENCTDLLESNPVNIPNCTTLYRAFYNCASLEKVGMINSKRVKDFSHMFSGNTNLKEVDYIDFSAAENTTDMFKNCTSLTNLKIIHGSLTTSLSLQQTKINIQVVKQILTDAGNSDGSELDIRNTPAAVNITSDILDLATNKGWILRYTL